MTVQCIRGYTCIDPTLCDLTLTCKRIRLREDYYDDPNDYRAKQYIKMKQIEQELDRLNEIVKHLKPEE